MKTTMKATGTDIDITVNNITMCYDDLGNESTPIIFVHGFPFNKSLWQPQMEFLKNTHRVIAYDIRGFGKTSSGKEDISIPLFADDLITFMDALEINKAIVCGSSMGGYILLNAIHHYSNRFKAIILSDTQCISDSYEMKVERYKTILKMTIYGLEDFANEFVPTIFCPESLNTKKEVVEKIKHIILSTSPETITRTLKALVERWQMCSSLNEISIPTLILCGKEDKITPLSESEFMLKNIKNSIFHTINSAGHLPNLEQPEEFNRHLVDFVSGLENNSDM